MDNGGFMEILKSAIVEKKDFIIVSKWSRWSNSRKRTFLEMILDDVKKSLIRKITHDTIELLNGSRIMFKTQSQNLAGFSRDTVIVGEIV